MEMTPISVSQAKKQRQRPVSSHGTETSAPRQAGLLKKGLHVLAKMGLTFIGFEPREVGQILAKPQPAVRLT